MTNQGRSSLGQLTNQLTQQQSQLQREYYQDTMGNVGPWGQLQGAPPGHQQMFDNLTLGMEDPQAYNRLAAEAASMFQPASAAPARGQGGGGGRFGGGFGGPQTRLKLPAGGQGTPLVTQGDARLPFSPAPAAGFNMPQSKGKSKFPNPFV